ncbi:shikimate kinase [Cryobacterium mesophilum]|uniref:Shikimate kinase n=1 Tax=Terrimesophilobacter mesophilus TaxID=433647 RepID=A0A4R8V9W6_9MICO|nr:shikimate kinase [Terrimesophilobacter mesophilus]MBB5631872.1 shikimate kinase [Terrimesophilobacter mesophilus]TFB78782.1 shikimate kinase [Terrimesophilobacter mesophilus]
MSENRPVLVVIGPPGAGKSVLGRRVAKLLRVPFVDTDRRIVASHGPIATIFAERGEEWFRAAERIEVARALVERAVVALGGGAVLDPDTQADLAACRVVLVTVSADAVGDRIRGSVRPLLENGLESWQAIVDARRQLYERLATRTVDSSERTVLSLAHEVADWIRREDAA